MRNAIFPQCFEDRRSRQVGQQGRSTKDRKGDLRTPRAAARRWLKADLKHIRRWTEKSSICSLSRTASLAVASAAAWLCDQRPQSTVTPTGSSTLTAGRILPGLNVDLGWEVVKDFFGIELLIANNFVQDNMHNTGFQVATGLTGLVQITKKLEAFAEWDAFYPTGSISSSGPQQYAVGGLVYFVTPNLALDARMGVGLNSRSNNFLTGVGFAARY
jgi:hypothetical protein